MTKRITKDGLPVVTEEILMEFLGDYCIDHPEGNDPLVTRRIKLENPQIHRLLEIGMNQAPNKAARGYYECGMQIVYELLRRQSGEYKKS